MMNSINLDIVNKKSPYELKLISDRVYEFVTDQGILYRLGFLDDESIISCKTYQFYISKLTPRHSLKDDRIKPTVISLIEAFFDANESVLLYMCDTEDGRQEMRSKLFLRWFNTNNLENKYICKETHLSVEGIKMYAAIILRQDNPYLQAVEDEFNETTRILSEGK